MNNTTTFLLFSGAILSALFLYAFYKAGWNKDVFMKNWFRSEGKTPVWKAVLIILLVPVVFAIVLKAVNAEEWFDGATVFTGIDYTATQSPLCQRFGVNNQITSNIGFTQDIYTQGDVKIGFKYTHHSCALNADQNAYDAGGIVVEWKIK